MRKADGAAFEREFRDLMKDRFYIRRLPTLRTGYAGLTQPADFILVGNTFNYVELKETAGDRISISTLQQYAEIKEFIAENKRLMLEMNYWLIVRFIGKGICAIANETIIEFGEGRKTLRYNSPEAIRFNTIEELEERNDLF